MLVPFFFSLLGFETIYKLPVDKTKESAVCFRFFFLFPLSGGNGISDQGGARRRGGHEETQIKKKGMSKESRVRAGMWGALVSHTPIARDFQTERNLKAVGLDGQ